MCNNGLILDSLESNREQYFRQRFESLLSCCTKEMIINFARDRSMFYCTFANAIVSPKELHLILLKKYYLSSKNNIYDYTKIDKLLEEDHFKELEEEIEQDSETRAILMQTYINNFKKSNHHLMAEKACQVGYDVVSNKLRKINEFYACQLGVFSSPLKKTYTQ